MLHSSPPVANLTKPRGDQFTPVQIASATLNCREKFVNRRVQHAVRWNASLSDASQMGNVTILCAERPGNATTSAPPVSCHGAGGDDVASTARTGAEVDRNWGIRRHIAICKGHPDAHAGAEAPADRAVHSNTIVTLALTRHWLALFRAHDASKPIALGVGL